MRTNVFHIYINAIVENKNSKGKKQELLIKVWHIYTTDKYVKQNFILSTYCVLTKNKFIHNQLNQSIQSCANCAKLLSFPSLKSKIIVNKFIRNISAKNVKNGFTPIEIIIHIWIPLMYLKNSILLIEDSNEKIVKMFSELNVYWWNTKRTYMRRLSMIVCYASRNLTVYPKLNSTCIRNIHPFIYWAHKTGISSSKSESQTLGWQKGIPSKKKSPYLYKLKK